jgi:hypothetical protein
MSLGMQHRRRSGGIDPAGHGNCYGFLALGKVHLRNLQPFIT